MYFIAGYTVANDYAIRDYAGELVPAQPAGEKPRHLHTHRPMAGGCSRRAQPE